MDKKEFIVPSEAEKSEWRANLYRTLWFLATEHHDLQPRKSDSLEMLLESFLYWADEYNEGYFPEKDNADTNRYCAWLVQEQLRNNNYEQFIREYETGILTSAPMKKRRGFA